MKKIFLAIAVLLATTTVDAQFTSASLQASGLTCSMCSKAVKVALEEVPFVEKVQVDIKNQRYNLAFKTGVPIEIDALNKAVVDAGFSIAGLNVTGNVDNIRAEKDSHVSIGGQTFHFLNGKGQVLTGPKTFTVVDKSFVSAKEFKKYSSASKMQCVQSGRAEACCTKDGIAAQERVYHVII